MCAMVKKIISGNELLKKRIITLNAFLPNDKYILLKGTVYNPHGKPLSGAAIEVIQINNTLNPSVEKNIGITFTLNDGSYGIPLLWEKGYAYKLTAYSP
ncbi:hypothetical protein [Clostridium beijerinckii]|uniref:hypothetical protein n=1 Tax=Clostridium beijerinckii TaxID=1520 RepID=UPI0023308681|nr:hypothetical protein [Clostridium beijerinckii]